jgi:hypothetical protein
MPSISTGGAAMNAMMKQMVAARRHGIISVPNQPTYRRLSVLVTQLQKESQVLRWDFGAARIAVIVEVN